VQPYQVDIKDSPFEVSIVGKLVRDVHPSQVPTTRPTEPPKYTPELKSSSGNEVSPSQYAHAPSKLFPFEVFNIGKLVKLEQPVQAKLKSNTACEFSKGNEVKPEHPAQVTW
jgi:hypothetical protein